MSTTKSKSKSKKVYSAKEKKMIIQKMTEETNKNMTLRLLKKFIK
jgi:hypothetical protein